MRRARPRRALPPPLEPHDPTVVRRRLDDRVGRPVPSHRRGARRAGLRRTGVALFLAVALGVAGVSQLGTADVVAPHAALAGDALAGAAAPEPAADESGEQPRDEAADEAAHARTPTGTPVTLAFAGDVHAERGSGAALRDGLPSIRHVLGAADLTVVNVEMAITERGTPADKAFAFRAPASALSRLKEAGVDVATLANNHGLDYGPSGLRDTLAAADEAGLPVVGLGLDEDRAYAPHVATVHGQRIAVLGATQVLDGDLTQAWTAGPAQPGMASAKRVARLVQEVERARREADTVVVYLHWGQERNACPLPRQEELAAQLVAAGADVVVGTHAHVLLGAGYLDGAYVDYGLGNFVFGARSVESARTGVLTLTVQGRAVTDAAWAPAVIREGAPYPLSGRAAARALADKDGRRSCTGLSPTP